MKKLICILLMVSFTASAEQPIEKFMSEFYPSQECVPVNDFKFIVISRLNKDEYELRGSRLAGAERAIIKLNYGQFTAKMRVNGFMVKYKGSKMMTAADGFKYKYAIIEDCK